jgi:hypothetical protein
MRADAPGEEERRDGTTPDVQTALTAVSDGPGTGADQALAGAS